MVKGKKGAEMTIGTIVIIVLAIVVLVVLVLGFSTGWKNLWAKITAFLGGGPNVDDIVLACTLACDSESKNGFCLQGKEVKADSETFWVDKDGKAIDPKGEEVKNEGSHSIKSVKLKCKDLADWYPELNFQKCPALDCTTPAA